LLETHTDIEQSSISTTNSNMASAILLHAQKESHRNLQPFTGDLSQDVDEYIDKIEHIGSFTKEPQEVLHVLLTEKLSGQAEKWYKDNHESLTTWSKLKSGFRDRFQQPWLNQTLFSTLDNRKQEAHESVNDYYDIICRLCHRVDPDMSQHMILHFLQKGIRDDMKTNITRLMLTEKDPTPETFLKFAKIEEFVDRTNQRTDSSATYFTSPTQSHMMTSAINSSSNTKRSTSMLSTPRTNPRVRSTTDSRFSYNPPPSSVNNSSQQRSLNHQTPTLTRSQPLHLLPCLVCGRHNHRTMDCYQRKSSGCFKCGNNDHRVGQCPQVFF
jgi:hypothetical protein